MTAMPNHTLQRTRPLRERNGIIMTPSQGLPSLILRLDCFRIRAILHIMHALFVIILLTVLVLPAVAFAEVQTFTTTHTYVLGDDDSRNSARQKCLSEAKRKILEQVGVYLESKSELITSSQSTTSGSAKSPQTTNEERQQITEQINTLAAGVMRTEVIKEDFGEINGRSQMTLTLKVEVDPDDIRKQLAERRVDQKVRNQVVEQAERLKKLEESLSAMMEEMRTKGGDAPRRAQKQNDLLPSATDLATIRERANAGDTQAQNLLGDMYVVGKNFPQDYAIARQWYEKAAAQGFAMAQFNLGCLYDYGQSVPQDYTKAREWFEKAAAQGYAQAQFNLGVMHGAGQGVPQDYDEARQWYEKAAAQGHAKAQFNLGTLYNVERGLFWIRFGKGQGVPTDYAIARQWFEKAAAQGLAEAQLNLGALYANGRGVPQNDKWAYMWHSLAAPHLTGDAQKLAVGNRDKIARRMTPAQIAEAQQLAQQCQSQQFKGC
jgi:TPR repeat protein